PRRVSYVREYGSRISRSQAFDPGNHELRFAQCQTVLVDELSITGDRSPGRHMASDNVRTQFASSEPGLLVSFERKRWAVLRVAHHAVLVENADDLAVEEHRRGQSLMGKGNGTQEARETQEGQKSCASCASCVPVFILCLRPH